jgi:solute carrier family 50 (sugar transporter)
MANAPGFLLSIWFNLCAVKLQHQDYHVTEIRQSLTQFLDKNTLRDSMNRREDSIFLKNEPEEEEEELEVVNGTDDKIMPISSLSTKVDTIPGSIPYEPPWHTLTDLNTWIRNITSPTCTSAPAPQEKLIMMMFILWTTVFSIVAFIQVSSTSSTSTIREFIVGCIVNVNVVFFYGAPLSTMITVLQQRNSASIHIPTMITNTLNSVFWAAYGLAILDIFILIPNSIGVVLGSIQIVLVLLLPRHSTSTTEKNDNDTHSQVQDTIQDLESKKDGDVEKL